jgi:dTDP-4-dehydrorhamnose reductase
VLDTAKLRAEFGLALPDWRDGLRATVRELAQAR